MSDQAYPKGRTPFLGDAAALESESPNGNTFNPQPPLEILDYDKVKIKTIVK